MVRRRMKLADLPLKAFTSIVASLDDQSACELRKVSRSTRDSVDAVMLNARENLADVACFRDESANEIIVVFSLPGFREYQLWRNLLYLATRQLQINSDKIHLKKNQFIVDIYLSVEDTKRVLEFLKERTVNTSINFVRFIAGAANAVHWEWIDYLDGKECSEMALICSVDDTEIDRNILIELSLLLADSVDSVSIFCPHLTRDYALFAIEVAKYVEVLEMGVEHCDGHNILCFIREILSGLCHNFTFTEVAEEEGEEEEAEASISADDIEKLVQLVHGLEKTVTIDISTSAPPMDKNFGVYNVRIIDGQEEHNSVIIEPIED